MGLPLHDVYILAAVEDSATKMLRRNCVAQCKFGSGSLADIASRLPHVRFTPMCGRLRVGKDFFHACRIGRCARVFGLEARFT